MTKGTCLSGLKDSVSSRREFSVMSGLITGPNFQSFFHKPDAVALGTMVAVLEIGAFSKHRFLVLFHEWLLTSICFFSYLDSRWARRRYDRTTNDIVLWRSGIHDRRRSSDIHSRIWSYGCWEDC